MLSIGSVTPYEIYINKIKSGSLINSSDQAFDSKTTSTAQTTPYEMSDFANQCPQDYQMVGGSTAQHRPDPEELF